MTPQQMAALYMRMGLLAGPLGLWAAYLAIQAVQPERTVLGVPVPGGNVVNLRRPML